MPQSFQTRTVGNTSLAYYTLSLRKPGDLKSVVPLQSYTFPLSPQELKRTPTAYNTIYDTGGSAKQNGVKRQVDLFGQSPPIFEIRGTTGWKQHNTDAYLTNGLTSISKLEKILEQFAKLNQQQVANQATDFYTLEFYDYFRNDFWQVVPIGPQTTSQSSQSPILSFYSLRLAAIQKVSSPIPTVLVDLIGNTVGTGVLSAISSASSFVSLAVGLYNVI